MGDVTYRILLIEDCKRGMSRIFAEFAYSKYNHLHINMATSIADAEHRLETSSFSVVILSPKLPQYEGASTVNYIKKLAGSTPLVIVLEDDNVELSREIENIGVERVFHGGAVDIAAIEDICLRFKPAVNKAAAKKKVSVVAGVNSDGAGTLEGKKLLEEIEKHRQALNKARQESEANKDAILKAKQDSLQSRQEAESARREAEQIKEKVQEFKQQILEQSRELEKNKLESEKIIQDARAIKENSELKVQKIETECSSLYDTAKNFGDVVRAKEEAEESVRRLQQELAESVHDKNDLNIKFEQLQQNLSGSAQEKQQQSAQLSDLHNEVQRLSVVAKELGSSLDESNIEGEKCRRDMQDAVAKAQQAEEAREKAYARASNAEENAQASRDERNIAVREADRAVLEAKKLMEERDRVLAQAAATQERESAAKLGVAGLTEKLTLSEKMVDNLQQVVATLEERCCELEAGQAALIEAEHVGLERERGARETAEKELGELKVSLSDFAAIEKERDKLEQLLKEEQDNENQLIEGKAAELERMIATAEVNESQLQQQIAALNSSLQESKNELAAARELSKSQSEKLSEQEQELTALKNEKAGVELRLHDLNDKLAAQQEQAALVITLEQRVVEFKQTLLELSQERDELKDKLLEGKKGLDERAVVVESLEREVADLKAECEKLRIEKDESVEAYVNKSEAVQQRLARSEELLKECEWKLQQESEGKEEVERRVEELSDFEEQIVELQLEIEMKNDLLQKSNSNVYQLNEKNEALIASEEALKDRMQLESLQKDMQADTLKKQLEEQKNIVHELQQGHQQALLKHNDDREIVANHVEEIQSVLRETTDKLKQKEWDIKQLNEKIGNFKERIVELEEDGVATGELHAELDELKHNLSRSEKKVLVLSNENEILSGKVEDWKKLVSKFGAIEKKAELADKVAHEVRVLKNDLKQEQINYRKLSVELHKADARQEHLAELQEQNKKLGWEVEKLQEIIENYEAEEERRRLAATAEVAEMERLQRELKQQQEELNRVVVEKEEFTKKQLDKVEELSELYEKAQVERLELLEKLNDGKGL